MNVNRNNWWSFAVQASGFKGLHLRIAIQNQNPHFNNTHGLSCPSAIKNIQPKRKLNLMTMKILNILFHVRKDSIITAFKRLFFLFEMWKPILHENANRDSSWKETWLHSPIQDERDREYSCQIVWDFFCFKVREDFFLC